MNGLVKAYVYWQIEEPVRGDRAPRASRGEVVT